MAQPFKGDAYKKKQRAAKIKRSKLVDGYKFNKFPNRERRRRDWRQYDTSDNVQTLEDA